MSMSMSPPSPPRSAEPPRRPRNAALQRARASKDRLQDADDSVALSDESLMQAVGHFFGPEAAQLQRAVTSAAPSPAAAITPARVLLSTLHAQRRHEGTFEPIRGLLKKRGGGRRFTTWHWRFCLLHPHAIAVHGGIDRPGAIRSAVALKHVVNVCNASAAECGDRPFAFAVHCDDRSWVFCCMSAADHEAWVTRLKRACALTHGSGLSRALAI